MNDTTHMIGHIQDSDQGRDAIHVPVITMMAKTDIHIGRYEKIFVDKDGNQVSETSPLMVGVIDPWLPAPTKIEVGKWFFVFLRPGSIKSLQHVWDHRDFPKPEPEVKTVEVIKEVVVYRERDDDDTYECSAC